MQNGNGDVRVDDGSVTHVVKKRKTLRFGKLLEVELPCADMYEQSFMHRDVITHIVLTGETEFLVTGSADGHIKFWKKRKVGIEFAKHFRAHTGPISAMTVSIDGLLLATISVERSVKVFDVPALDMVSIISLPFVPSHCEWVATEGARTAILALVDDKKVFFLDVHNQVLLDRELAVHKHSICALKFNPVYNMMVSADVSGIMEYWNPVSLSSRETKPTKNLQFEFKIQTDLFIFLKLKAIVHSISFSPDGELFATVSSDRVIRVFHFSTGKVFRKFDETLKDIVAEQKRVGSTSHLDPMDFSKRIATEQKIVPGQSLSQKMTCCFDSSSCFLLYPTMLGIKVVNILENNLIRTLGVVEGTDRFLGLQLFQSKSKEHAAIYGSSVETEKPDPILFCTSFGKRRFFLFTRREPEGSEGNGGRDVFNEPPTKGEIEVAKQVSVSSDSKGASRAIVHTSVGDITLKLFPVETPKTVLNFTVHARNGYYNGLLFHRVIQGFMIQTGDPLGDGSGGESIWGGEFEDEIVRTLRHDRAFTLSMANAGPNTNGSQFFITTVPTPWLDGKHTVFGRIVGGMDTVQTIERAPTDKLEKPEKDIKIVSIEIPED